MLQNLNIIETIIQNYAVLKILAEDKLDCKHVIENSWQHVQKAINLICEDFESYLKKQGNRSYIPTSVQNIRTAKELIKSNKNFSEVASYNIILRELDALSSNLQNSSFTKLDTLSEKELFTIKMKILSLSAGRLS